MASPDLALERLQRWMQQAVVSENAPTHADAEILPSATLTPDERIDIYHRMYPIRMREALQSDYPALAHFLGDDGFEALVRRYVAAHPSRSYTLNRLGDHLAAFIAETGGVPKPAFCAELAQLEYAITLVFDAPETPLLDAAALAERGEAVADVRLRPIEAFRLLRFRYPVDAYLDSVRDESHAHPKIALKSCRVAVFRHAYAVQRLSLDKEAFTLLAAIEAGRTLGEAVMAALHGSRRALDPDEFFRWFRAWVAAGMFRALDPA
jgi:hypothetical protein